MTPDRFRRAQDLFASAVGRAQEARVAYLDGACGDDTELRREVESLLASHEAAGAGFLESPAIDEMTSLAPTGSGRKPLSRGDRLGSFEIVAPLGAGGMGEVYRAKDPRLGRDVAIKVLPGDLISDRERLKRFEKEARSASALNHPNIVTIYETGTSEGVPWIAMEHVEGLTLRTLLTQGSMPVKRVLGVATQIAEGLARAHEAGIVHRDLKPENVMVTRDGLVKILDFGLAKLSTPVSGGSDEESQLPTVTGTSPGIVLGTVGYMSPEQACGKLVDYRSDQFALGSMLYEMATGRRAFQKKTAVDTLSAILNEEPESVASINSQTPAPLRWIVERCLAKDPQDRYVSTRDLARELATVQGHLSEAFSGPTPVSGPRARWRSRAVGALGVIAAIVAASLLATSRSRPAAIPQFQKVTFQQGGLWRARFAPDGQTVVYSMVGVGGDLKPAELFSTRVGSLDPRPLGLPPADIFSVSRTGMMAIGLPRNPHIQDAATLAEASLTGGAPRPLLEDVLSADWSPDGKELAAVRVVGGKSTLEYPIGKALRESTEYVAEPRVSPDGALVAFLEGPETMHLRIVDRKGALRTLSQDTGAGVVCWSPDGRELWWFKQPNVGRVISTELHAIDLKGQERTIASLPGEFNLLDISADGRLLAEHVSRSYAMMGTFPGESGDRDLAWLDQSAPGSLSPDGKLLLFEDRGDAGGKTEGSYLRKTDGSPAVKLGEGSAGGISPDGKWALVCRKLPKHYLVLIPLGAGQDHVLPPSAAIPNGMVQFHPDGKSVLFEGAEPDRPERVYRQDIDGGPPRMINTPEGVGLVSVSPGGTQILTRGQGARDLTLWQLGDGGVSSPRTIPLQATAETFVHWSPDGRSILVVPDGRSRPIRVERLDLSSGKRTLWREFTPPGALGAGSLGGLALTDDERAWVVGYQRYFSELLVIDGLK